MIHNWLCYPIICHQPCQYHLLQAITSAMNAGQQRKSQEWEHPFKGNIADSSYIPTAPNTIRNANPSWASLAENGSISPQLQHPARGQRRRPQFNYGQVMAGKKLKIKIEPNVDLFLVQIKFDQVVPTHSNPSYNKSWIVREHIWLEQHEKEMDTMHPRIFMVSFM